MENCECLSNRRLETTSSIWKLETTSNIWKLETTSNIWKLETTSSIWKLETTWRRLQTFGNWRRLKHLEIGDKIQTFGGDDFKFGNATSSILK